MANSFSSRAGAILLFLGALAGLAVALYGYFTPLTGVTGTLGALLVILVSAILAILALILAGNRERAGRIALRIIILIGLAGNAFAAALLHEWWLCIAMAVGLVGLVINTFSPRIAH